MPTEHTTVVVSVNTEWDEETRMEHINAQVERGWRVRSVTPISGGGAGPGGASEDFMRLQVILERDIDEQNVIETGGEVDASNTRSEQTTASDDEDPDDTPASHTR